MEAQNPHLLVTSDDRSAILEKIEEQAWARLIYDEMMERVTPYADRHRTDPEWILSRYLMNRVPGKRYTHAYADNHGQALIGCSGDAPVPTVRVPTYLRAPITDKGTRYRMPEIEELLPNDTARLMYLVNPDTGLKEPVDPQAYISSINGDINNRALDAAVLYWLNGEEKYARFAADILNQWVAGVYYQEPIVGPGRTGLLDIQTLGDAAYSPLILAYDFVKPYMEKQGYQLEGYETVFEKFASTMVFRGYWNNNWYAAESSLLVLASLSLEDAHKRTYYLQYFLEKDTVNGAYGQLALPTTVNRWLTHDGHWKEPGGYHNYPVRNLMIASLAMEKNGYDIFQRFPELLGASYAMLKYSFPNLTVGAFGDTGRASQSAESLEIGLVAAAKYQKPEKEKMVAAMQQLIESGKYRRETAGYLGLLCFLPEISPSNETYSWPRSGSLEFARYFIQRNGTDKETGLMVGVQGASYNHNHCNGMAMELYGLGEVMGLDAGTGPNYEHPMHRNYYAQWAAHNTVVAAGSSASVPFNGAAGTKDIGAIELVAMEPLPDKESVSDHVSVTNTHYFDRSTNTNQHRTLSIVRTSETSGYYVDIYRSDNPVSNDYIYHNIGDELMFLDNDRNLVETEDAIYPLTGEDYPGFRFFNQVNKLKGYSGNLISLFAGKDDNNEDIFMQAFIAGSEDRTYFRAMSPKASTAPSRYRGKELPVFTIRTEKPATNHPFIVVYEPYRGSKHYGIEQIAVERRNDTDVFTALTVFNRDGSHQHIFQSVDATKKFDSQSYSFSGNFGVASFSKTEPTYLYLGCGTEVSTGGYSLQSNEREGSACLVVMDDIYKISCNQPTVVGLPRRGVKKVIKLFDGKEKSLPFEKSGNSIFFEVDESKEATIRLIY